MSRFLVTGAAGFIGYHTSKALLDRGDEVIGLDNLNAYYDPQLKRDRLALLRHRTGFDFVEADLSARSVIEQLFGDKAPNRVIHLGAQVGVRYSVTDPHSYVNSNLVGFLHILEGCRHHRIEHLTYASSSSVYGANTSIPFSEHQNVDHPISLYAATKKANELMAHTYSHLYGLPTTGLRFFTVYGPWGRPDMALFLFTKAILEDKPIQVFNNGKMRRDFTYVDDIVQAVLQASDHTAEPNPDWNSDTPDPATSRAPYRIYNVGNNSPVELAQFIGVLEKALSKEAKKVMMPMQAGDLPETYADIESLCQDIGFRPTTSLEEGIQRFVDWYRDYYGV